MLAKKDDKYSIINIETKKEEVSNINKFTVVHKNKEKILIIYTDNGIGIISNSGKEILSPIYNQIDIIPNNDSPLFIAKQILNEANLLINLYVDLKGKIVKNQALKIDEKIKIECF